MDKKNKSNSAAGIIKVFAGIILFILLITVVLTDVKSFSVLLLILLLVIMGIFSIKAPHGLSKDYNFKEYKPDEKIVVDISHIIDKMGEEIDPKRKGRRR